MQDGRIVLLDENTANRIAAGEVVERPASAVKELVENAIDAGASVVNVTLEEGGKRRISVSDNGTGMNRTDAIMALQRHATSKIRSADDLFAIHTLGFRGEALPSIASVSRFTLLTRAREDEVGSMLTVEGGDLIDVSDAAVSCGTTIEVADLFFNTPARLKFLKSTAAEMSRTLEALGSLAIAYPAVSFRIQHGNVSTFTSPGTGEPLAAIAAVWGRESARKLIPIEIASPGLHVTGFVSTPDHTRPGRSHELFFVNNRPIKSRLIAHALEDAFRSLTPESRYPLAVIMIEVSPDMVDVNVHPTKTEVKFTRDGEVHHAVSQAVKQALLRYGIVPTATATALPLQTFGTGTVPDSGQDETKQPALFDPRPTGSAFHSNDAFTLSRANQDSQPGSFGAVAFGGSADTLEQMFAPVGAGELVEQGPQEELLQVPRQPKPFAERLREFSVIGQAQNTYIIALTPDGIAIVDQHVAHERVLYERLTVKRFSMGIPVQRLAIPLTINMSRREAMLLAEHIESFAESGWEISPFGGESFVVRAIPAVLVNKPYESILKDMIEELVNQSISRKLLVLRDHVTITNACKMAVKAGDPLTIEEMTALLEQLAETENPYLCPHGRPIVVTIGFSDIDKLFKRA
jgi:DNA mismatch repair protein MutL